MASNATIVITPQELVKKLNDDVQQLLGLRNALYYQKLPANDADSSKWEHYAYMVDKWSNEQGRYLADAEKIVKALRLYVAEVEGE